MRQVVGPTISRGTAGQNPEVWVQLGKENENTNIVLLETVDSSTASSGDAKFVS